MSKHRVAVLKVVSKQLSVTAAAAAYGISRQQLTRLVRRYRDGGLEALEPRSRRPLSNPGHTPDATRDRIVALRRELIAHGLDAGPVTIALQVTLHRRPGSHDPPRRSGPPAAGRGAATGAMPAARSRSTSGSMARSSPSRAGANSPSPTRRPIRSSSGPGNASVPTRASSPERLRWPGRHRSIIPGGGSRRAPSSTSND